MPHVRTIGLPLRVTPDGQLERSDGAAAILRLIQAMVATTAASWPHARWFGLHERFLAVNADVEDQAGLADALNEALPARRDWARVRRSGASAAAPPRASADSIYPARRRDGQPVSAAVTT